MEQYARQQFDFFLNTAIERFIDRVEQRCGGPVPALAQLRSDPNGEGMWLSDFVIVLFRDFMIDNTGGACFVLQALARRPVPVVSTEGQTIDQALQTLARAAFAAVLEAKSAEMLEQRLVFQVTE